MEQAVRIRERIESLENRKAQIIAGVDRELAELNSDLSARERAIEEHRRKPDTIASALSTGNASVAAKPRDADPASGKERKATPPSAKRGAVVSKGK